MPTDDDRRHEPTTDRWWGEIWDFEFATPDASLALTTRLAIYPNLHQTWFWAAVVQTGRQYVLCRDHDLAAPRPAWPLEIRGGSLWMHAICETPFEHWTVAMEAYAVGFDDPMEAWRSERGDKVGLAFDLEWERLEMLTRRHGEGFDGYELACRVSGVLQIDDETIDVDTAGNRMHTWGIADLSSLTVKFGLDSGAGAVAHACAPLQVELPDGSTRTLLRSLRRFPNGSQRFDLEVSP